MTASAERTWTVGLGDLGTFEGRTCPLCDGSGAVADADGALTVDCRRCEGDGIVADRDRPVAPPSGVTVERDQGGGFDEWWTVRYDGDTLGRVCRQVMSSGWLAYSRPRGDSDCVRSRGLHGPRQPFGTLDAAVAAVLASHRDVT